MCPCTDDGTSKAMSWKVRAPRDERVEVECEETQGGTAGGREGAQGKALCRSHLRSHSPFTLQLVLVPVKGLLPAVLQIGAAMVLR